MQYKNFMTSPRRPAFTEKRKSSYYKSGVKVRFPKKSPPMRIQILPAYNPDNPSDAQGCVPCLVDGLLTSWFGMIQAAKFVGHGDWRSTSPILSLVSFEGNEPCPYIRVLSYCNDNPDWKYLVTSSGKFGAPDFKDAVLKPVKKIMLMNIVDVDNPSAGVQIGEFNYSVANTLINVETGLVFQRNLQIDNYPDAAALLASNPMLAYANGDITDPARAPVFIVELPPVRQGQFGTGYTARIEVTGGQVTRRSASDFELSERYHFEDPFSFLDIPTGQDIVDELSRLLKGHKNARGIDETCVLKEALGDTYRVDMVQAPGAVSTVQGFTAPAAPAPRPEVARPPVQMTVPPTTPAGFAPNPATQVKPQSVAPAAVAASQTATPSASPTDAYPGQTMAIPGEIASGGEAALAASLAERMRAQMGIKK